MDKRFHLERDVDVSGVWGVGIVATGIRFLDGSAVLHWMGTVSSTAVYSDINDLIQIHGHQGATRLVFDDNEIDMDAELQRKLQDWRNANPANGLTMAHEEGFEYGFEMGFRIARGEIIE